VAAMMVLTFHVVLLTPRIGFGPFGRVVETFGSLGVELFFVISGFLLYRPFAASRSEGRPPPDLRRYVRRRALRIVPAYWVILTVFAIYPGLHFDGGFWRYYGFLQLYDSDTVGLGLPVAWSLCVEVTFYAALPLWAWLVRRAGLRTELAALALAALGGAALQLAAVDHHALHTVARTLLGQAPYFAVGMTLALLHVSAPGAAWAARRSEQWWLGAGAALALLAWQIPPGGIFGSIRQDELLGSGGMAVRLALSLVFVALVALPAVYGDEAGGLPRRFLAWRPVAWVGTVSYSVYLWHLPIAELLARPSVPEQFDAGGLDLVNRVDVLTIPLLWYMTATFALALSWLTFRYVEAPFIRLASGARRPPRDEKEW
ncbi:MAG: acyltransferase, partial [Solirubrobacterales bacterium]|nr:acyltransferase [Solirubrobacterales bacterium]